METIKVMPWGKSQGEFVIIDKSEFDPSIHKEYSAQKPQSNQTSQKNNRSR